MPRIGYTVFKDYGSLFLTRFRLESRLIFQPHLQDPELWRVQPFT